jgi:DNA polymerase-1
MSRQPYFLIIDGHALIYRAYHAFPDLSSPTGQLVNAVYGFTRHVLTAIREYQPDYIAVTFDHKKPTFRHADFVEYKANRVAMPDDLIPQIDIIKQVVTTLNFPMFELEGYEADDLIGTLTAQLVSLNQTTSPQIMALIVTGDRDSFQLVDKTTHVWLPGRTKTQSDTEYDWDGVCERMEVCPEQIVDLKALMGDASDNIPGVPGVGEKTAIKLLKAFDSLEKLYAAVEGVASAELSADQVAVLKETLKAKLVAGKDSALLSQKLARIDRTAPIDLDLEACRVCAYDKQAAKAMIESLGFKSLLGLLPADEFELSIQSALF